MAELVEPDQGDLAALPVQDRFVVLEMGKRNRRSAGKFPVEVALFRLGAKQRIEFATLVPEAAFVANLRCGAPEDDGAEVRISRVPQRFE
jgi:hypothetical protein